MRQRGEGSSISSLLIGCCFAVVVTIIVCGVIIMVAFFRSNPIGGFNKSAKEEKREDINITYDGLSFTLTNSFGKTVREIAAKRDAYSTDYSIDYPSDRAISDIDAFLNQPYKNRRVSLGFKDRLKSRQAISIYYENDYIKHEDDYKIGDAKEVNIALNIRNNEEAVLDGKIVVNSSTTKEDLLKSIPNAEEEIQDELEKEYWGDRRSVVFAKYKGRYLYVTIEKDFYTEVAIKYDEQQRF